MNDAKQAADDDCLRRLISLWDYDATSERSIHDSLLHVRLRNAQRILAPVLVAWDGQSCRAVLWLTQKIADAMAKLSIRNERGEFQHLEFATRKLKPATGFSKNPGLTPRELQLPPLPIGYYDLFLEMGDRSARSILISAPSISYQSPGNAKNWGAFLPMYALQSKHNWGAGNFSDWQRLGQWVSECGGEVMASLPLTSVFLEKSRCVESPYSPASRLFWNEFYIDIETLPEFRSNPRARRIASSDAFQSKLSRFRREKLIDYPAQMAARRHILELLADDLLAPPKARGRKDPHEQQNRLNRFQTFTREHPLVWEYARFRAAAEQHPDSWLHWEPRLRLGSVRADDFSPRAANYHAYVQWAASEQVDALGRAFHKASLQFYLDLPVGVHPDSFDVWKYQHVFAPGVSVGAPSDRFFTLGQNWGFPPLHPNKIREDGYRYVIDYLRFQMSHASMLRIDHVMGLHRLYWIPPGFPANKGAYVRYPAHEWHALFNLESHRHNCRLIGENLGIVPPEVNQSMERHGLGQMFILQFEQRADTKKALRNPPKAAVASINTHDTPTWTAHWKGVDIDDRINLGILTPGQARKERRSRKRQHQALVVFLGKAGLLSNKQVTSSSVLDACLQWLVCSPAETVLVNLEDLWGEQSPQNVPGTSCERPNWRRKAAATMDQLVRNPALSSRLRRILSARQSRNRLVRSP